MFHKALESYQRSKCVSLATFDLESRLPTPEPFVNGQKNLSYKSPTYQSHFNRDAQISVKVTRPIFDKKKPADYGHKSYSTFFKIANKDSSVAECIHNLPVSPESKSPPKTIFSR